MSKIIVLNLFSFHLKYPVNSKNTQVLFIQLYHLLFIKYCGILIKKISFLTHSGDKIDLTKHVLRSNKTVN
jgi:hypothetical protein